MTGVDSETASCCTPKRLRPAQAEVPMSWPYAANGPTTGFARDCMPVPGGKAMVGTRKSLLPVDGEGPLRTRRVASLWWSRGATTITDFAAFVAATGYVTEAEEFGWSFVFHLHLPPDAARTLGVDGAEWWRRVEGAAWHHPYGPDAICGPADHPVTHVSWRDARAFASWAKGRLPTEAEWEHAARGALGDVRYPWGNTDPTDHGPYPCNIWQGRFPHHDTGADGHAGTAPAISFAPNGYGLHNMVGNVWQWTADTFRVRTLSAKKRAAVAQGPERKVLKGGSYLCHASYCHRYRIAARTGNTADSSTDHTGFRVIYDSAPGTRDGRTLQIV